MAEAWFIHAEQMFLFYLINIWKKQKIQVKTEDLMHEYLICKK